MTDLEFQVLDELYFLTSFQELAEATALPKNQLKAVLDQLGSKGWLRCYLSPDEELNVGDTRFTAHNEDLLYLASKAGLLAHNLK